MNAAPQDLDPYAGQQRTNERAYSLIVGLLEHGDPIPHADVARDMLLMRPVVPDDAAAVTAEWGALGLLDDWRLALDYARQITGGADYDVVVSPPAGMRRRGSAVEAVLEGLGDDARAVAGRFREGLVQVGPVVVLILLGALVLMWRR